MVELVGYLIVSAPKPFVLRPAAPSTAGAPQPVSIDGLGAAAGAGVAAFTAVALTPVDAAAVAADLRALRDSLVAAGLMAAS